MIVISYLIAHEITFNLYQGSIRNFLYDSRYSITCPAKCPKIVRALNQKILLIRRENMIIANSLMDHNYNIQTLSWLYPKIFIRFPLFHHMPREMPQNRQCSESENSSDSSRKVVIIVESIETYAINY
jgi:hypothetical protein